MVALAVATTLLLQPTKTADAGTTNFSFAIDCDLAAGGIQSSCNPSAGAYTLGIVGTNTTGITIGVSALQIRVVGDNAPSFVPVVPVSCVAPALDCNPDFNQAAIPAGSFNCSAPPPLPDEDANPLTSTSFLGCNTGSPDAPFWANGETRLMATVSYTASDGVGDFTLLDIALYDENFNEVASCNPVIQFEATCSGATVQIGASAATSTPVPATNTPTPVVTPTPCAPNCPTATSEAFVTVTMTPTATVPGAGPTQPPATGGTPPPGGEQPGPGGEQPGGNTGGQGRGPIRLPDTGSGDSGGVGALTIALLALGAGVVAGGVYFGAAAAFAGRRKGED
jgi:hypothetical protein